MKSIKLVAALSVTVVGAALAAEAAQLTPKIAPRPPIILGAGAPAVQWRPGIPVAELQAAKIVRAPKGMRLADIQGLRDDQIIETPSGGRLQVARLRQIQTAVSVARQRTASPRQAGFAMLPVTRAPGQPRRPGEGAAQLLARPPTDVIRLKSGASVTVAQLRAMAPYVESRYHVDLTHPRLRPGLAGPAIKITSLAQLKALPPGTPDSQILETPRGTRVTAGELRAALTAARASRGGQ